MKLSECGNWTLERLETELSKLRARPSPTGSGEGRMAEDIAAPPAPPERQGVDYHTAADLYWTMDRSARLAWTRRGDEELRTIMYAEGDLPDEKKTRFYRGGVEWVPAQ